MSFLPARADHAAIQELEELFRTADPANTGLLSYSEFAYLILRSGGTQKQVDALIEKFSGPSRGRRVVYYGALLEQLYDSVEAVADARGDAENGGARHTSDSRLGISSLDCTSSAPGLDTSNNSPLPTPPVPTYGEPLPSRASRSPPDDDGGATAAAAPPPHGAMGASQYGVPSAASSSSPICRSLTHAGASVRSASTLASRESSTGTYETYNTYNGRSLPTLRSVSSANSLHSPLRGLSSPSSRFVESALRAATVAAAVPYQKQRLHSAPSQHSTHARRSVSRSRSHDEVCATPLTGSSVVGAQGGKHAGVYGGMPTPHYGAGAGPHPHVPPACGQAPLGMESRRRESSTERMVRAAAELSIRGRTHPGLGAEGDPGAGETCEREGKRSSSAAHAMPGALPSTSSPHGSAARLADVDCASRVAAPQARNTNTSLTGSCAGGSYARHVDCISDSSYRSDASAASLLSLRDIFERHLAPASSRDGVVLLSELEEALTTRGVDVHPLELEAVADSLELSTVSAATEHHSSVPQRHGYNANLNNGFGVSVARTGCVLRGSPHLLLSANASGIGSTGASTAAGCQTTITGGADRALNFIDFCVLISRLRPGLIQRIRSPSLWESAACIDEAEVLRRRQPPTPINSFTSLRAVGAEDEESVADVTVSPMTPEAVAPATPRSTVSSSSPRAHPSAQLHLRRPRSLLPHRFAAAPALSSTAPPTARQLSADQHFCVEHARRKSSYSERKEERGNNHHVSDRYAEPTAASKQRCNRRLAPPITTPRLSGTKVPLWHDDQHASARHSHANPTHSPSSASPGSSRGLTSPDELPYPRKPQPRRAHIALRKPTNDVSAHMVRKELDGGCARRAGEGACSPSPTMTASRLSPTSRSPSSPESFRRRVSTSSALPPRVLETLQSASLALLRRCAQLDDGRTGRIAPSWWLRVLRDACPVLTDAERLCVQEWIRARGHRSARGDHYAAVVEDILAESNITPLTHTSSVRHRAVRDGGSAAATSQPRPPATRVRRNSCQPAATAMRSSAPYTSTGKGASLGLSRSATKPRVAVRSEPSGRLTASPFPTTANGQTADKDMKRLLARELMTVCGGDVEALLEYFRAFDEAGTGFLVEHVWRASLEELFRRTEGQEAPVWVVDGCVHLSRVPLEKPATTPSPKRGTSRLVPPALSAARARVSQVPPAVHSTLCDYRYALEELGIRAGA
ncbi:hypothetical protein, conserved [Leishmania tarentolae]|uniref:EF-hand domain-containing protein n=1 Tax=Leishmania tarentolae TaxID=5689 RepID=A0A640KI88_LEITA|nr:hypothetical protein, conserved [Leishmania tarentolae]